MTIEQNQDQQMRDAYAQVTGKTPSFTPTAAQLCEAIAQSASRVGRLVQAIDEADGTATNKRKN